jgi:hypothetical protein
MLLNAYFVRVLADQEWLDVRGRRVTHSVPS